MSFGFHADVRAFDVRDDASLYRKVQALEKEAHGDSGFLKFTGTGRLSAAETLPEKGCFWYGAFVGHELVGYALFTCDGTSASPSLSLDDLNVSSGYRRSGIAAQLVGGNVHGALSRARAFYRLHAGGARVRLWTKYEADNVAVGALYGRLGFVPAGKPVPLGGALVQKMEYADTTDQELSLTGQVF